MSCYFHSTTNESTSTGLLETSHYESSINLEHFSLETPKESVHFDEIVLIKGSVTLSI